jgi:hypothetical protein
MGYRSEVTVVIYVPSESDTAYPLLKLWFDANYPHTEAKGEWCATIDYEEENRAIVVSYEDVKWYEHYEHPQAVDKLFSEVDTMFDQLQAAALAADTDDVSQDPNVTPFEIAYEYVRIGEEYQDIDINMSTNADCVTTVNRALDITFTLPTKKVTT